MTVNIASVLIATNVALGLAVAYLFIEVKSLRLWADWHKQDIKALSNKVLAIQYGLANQATSDNP